MLESDNTLLNGDRTAEHIAGKYLAFPLSREVYGIEILKVQEIIGVTTITRVPHATSCIRGVINLRGKIVPVIDLRLRFSLPPAPYNDKTCVIVVNIDCEGQKLSVGIIVDTVQEVINFEADQIAPPPDYGEQLDNRFMIGMGRKGSDELVVLIDIEKILLEMDGGELKKLAQG